jgi:hypothetical protein
VAAKSGRLVKVAKLLEKIAATLKRIGPKVRFLDKGHDATGTAVKVEKRAAKSARNRGMPDIDSPNEAKTIENNALKQYDTSNKDTGPKKKTEPESADQADKKKRKRTRADADREKINNLVKAGKIDEAREVVRPFMESGQWDEVVQRLDVSSPKDGAVFWSGAKGEASNFAKDIKLPNGQKAVTLEDTIGGKVLDGWKDWDKKGYSWDGSKGEPPPHVKDLWETASKKYSSNARGKVYSIQRASKANDANTIWNRIEYPELAKNKDLGLVEEINIILID